MVEEVKEDDTVEAVGGGAPKPDMIKYHRMRAAGIDDLIIRNKMRVDLIDEHLVRDFFGEPHPDLDEAAENVVAPTVPKPDMAKYEKMRTKGLPVVVIRNQMKKDGVDEFWQRHFFGTADAVMKEQDEVEMMEMVLSMNGTATAAEGDFSRSTKL